MVKRIKNPNGIWSSGVYRIDCENEVIYIQASSRDEARNFARKHYGVEMTDGTETELL